MASEAKHELAAGNELSKFIGIPHRQLQLGYALLVVSKCHGKHCLSDVPLQARGLLATLALLLADKLVHIPHTLQHQILHSEKFTVIATALAELFPCTAAGHCTALGDYDTWNHGS
jgi:hypothetical protein